ncbi:hypothetical protein BCV72DRAFT_214698 [Rhizopus microsporus var. microsporus]|uniref:BHLH domain-containing protein n=1 Tax=Rhizopus microsporus var. microsporus TaxID=86635 RepID=A0A1X0QSJ1_RHIZD|nr:hypothetical protein BCV72DRAFT_214698 [Rhizopus microsporus var. microsporus]
MSISERRASYPIQERIKIYSPDSMAKKLHELEKQPNKLVLHGVNILNKNTLVNELSTLVPRSAENGGPKCHRAKVLRYAIDYIRAMQEENNQLRQQLGQSASPPNSPPNSPPQQDIKISFCP